MKLLIKLLGLIPARGEKVFYPKKETRQSTTVPDNIPLNKWVKGGWSDYINRSR